MKRIGVIVSIGAQFVWVSLAMASEPICSGVSVGDAVPGCTAGDVILADSAIPPDNTVTPCLPEEQVRIVSRADGKVFVVVHERSTPTCPLEVVPKPRIHRIGLIDVDPNNVWKHFITPAGFGKSTVYSVSDGLAILREEGRVARGIENFAFRDLSSRVLSMVILESACQRGGQTREDMAFRVAPLDVPAETILLREHNRTSLNDCLTVAEFSVAVRLSFTQIRGYLSLIDGTKRVQSYNALSDTADGILLFKTYMQKIDAHMVEVEKRLPALRALSSEWEAYAWWSAHQIRPAIDAVYWEGLLEPEHLARDQWPALEHANKTIQGYFKGLANVIREVEKMEGVPKADIDALVHFAEDERTFWLNLEAIESVDRTWLRSIERARDTIMGYYP